MSSIWHDVRHALRVFGRRPGFVAVLVTTLALGVGANTAIFSVINALFLQPLSLPDSDRLVTVGGRTRDGRPVFVSYPDFEDLRREAREFTGLTAFVPQSVNLTGRDEPTRIRGGFVSDNFFDVVGVQPAAGRGFRAGDDAMGAAGVCVLDHETWKNRFGGDPAIVGQALFLNNAPFTVVGIMPAGFRFPFDEIEVWIPHHHWPPFAPNHQNRGNGLVNPIGRLRDGASLQSAAAELETIAARLAQAYPEAGEGRTLRARPVQEVLVSNLEQAALVLLGAVTLVMLLACANVGALLLANTAARLRELATRAALGAGRLRLARQLLSETLVIWLVGGAAGLVLGQWVLRALLGLLPEGLPGGIQPRLDGAVLAYTLGLSVVTALLFGILPAWRFSRPNLVDSLKEGGRAASAGRARLRAGLVVGQLALTLVLLAASASMVRTLERLARVDVGYRPASLLTMEYRLPTNKYPEGAQQWRFHQEVVERVRQLPGVRSASVVRALPVSGNGFTAVFEVPGVGTPSGAPLRALRNVVDP
ncbi:MAG TPA: ABC transporter permease, partial [Vicinamibacteria bacterium]|nr:ABC transporter permease [Vicinamibacteria bacterium]